MSQHFLHVQQIIAEQDLAEITALIDTANFSDGKATASHAAQLVKNNQQLSETSNSALAHIRRMVDAAVQKNVLFNIATLPQSIHPYIISKYAVGESYGWHVDSPVMGTPLIRTDLAMTIFLSDPTTYEGGELVIQTPAGNLAFKPAAGDAILYPCQYVHCVQEVKSGTRVAAVTWIQSNVASMEKRQILFDLNQVHSLMYQRNPNAPETNLLLQTHSNLFRMWAEV
jgi:PKHD-type hydroxylase